MRGGGTGILLVAPVGGAACTSQPRLLDPENAGESFVGLGDVIAVRQGKWSAGALHVDAAAGDSVSTTEDPRLQKEDDLPSAQAPGDTGTSRTQVGTRVCPFYVQ